MAKRLLNLFTDRSRSLWGGEHPGHWILWISVILLALLLSVSVYAQETILETPIEISKTIYGAGEILMPCEVQGEERACKLDMGAPFSIFTDIENTEGLNVINQINYVGVTGSSVKCDVATTVNPIRFASVEVKDSLFLNCPRGNRNQLLGLNHLMTKPFKIDFSKQTFSVFEESKVLSHDYIVDSSGHVFIKIKLVKSDQQVEIMAMLDTGAGITIVSQDLVQKLPQFFSHLGSSASDVQDTNANPIQNKMLLVSSIVLDQKRVTIPYALSMDFTDLKSSTGYDIDMIIGLNVLREVRALSINPKNSTWMIE